MKESGQIGAQVHRFLLISCDKLSPLETMNGHVCEGGGRVR